MSDLASTAVPGPTADIPEQGAPAPGTSRSTPAAARGPSSLPLPSLEDTCARYLEMARPLVPLVDWERTAHAASRLAATGGPLQDALRRIAKRRNGDYVGGFWRDMYLEARAPLAPIPERRRPVPAAGGTGPTQPAAAGGGYRRGDRTGLAADCCRQLGGRSRPWPGPVPSPASPRLRRGATARPAQGPAGPDPTPDLFVVSHRGRLHHLPLPVTARPRAAARRLEPLFQAIIAGREPAEAVAALTSLSRPDSVPLPAPAATRPGQRRLVARGRDGRVLPVPRARPGGT